MRARVVRNRRQRERSGATFPVFSEDGLSTRSTKHLELIRRAARYCASIAVHFISSRLRDRTVARHQSSSADYVVPAKRRRDSICPYNDTSPFTCARSPARTIDRARSESSNKAGVCVLGFAVASLFMAIRNYTECERPPSCSALFVVNSSNSSRINHSPIRSHCARHMRPSREKERERLPWRRIRDAGRILYVDLRENAVFRNC